MGTRFIGGVVSQLHGEYIQEVRDGTVFTAELEIIVRADEGILQGGK
ncbi:hypothetical protein QO002_005754 [Pararhizobium capsulatum DSM 1112]|uniref:Uncharacterized protein n=1 Tax=Pararhizobium capsulatum DSM 1112 TaxID=1121113 RepID=A0ABU0BZ59_9HYPH|nr:hypothetical protein [Pararhizobium capsulatum]MDQ0323548.1 hypothetical protein [Pararhizobium capsulatum DSM 1112]